MRNLYKYLVVPAVLATFFSLSVAAQTWYEGGDAKALLKEDITRCVNLHHNYEVPEKIVDTPAPKGYKPFYVSHYGRHGSRYHWTYSHITRASSVLDSLYAHNLLTAEGLAVRDDIEIIIKAHEGQTGYLTHKGAAQHQGIAHRLYSRCPEVFNQKDRNEVYCTATAVQRCIQSMANFGVQLARENPGLDITMDAGERFADYICNTKGADCTGSRANEIMDSVLTAKLDPSRLMNSWVTDKDAALKYIRHGDARKFIYYVFWAGGIGQCLDIQDPNIFRHFTFDELYALWAYNDTYYYNEMCGTVENGRIKDIVGIRILRDIVEKADAALEGNNHAADLRFGHDSGLSPLLSLLRLEGYEQEKHLGTASDGSWYGFQGMPMASNLQMIFYRNKKGDVLVKLLRNEVETTIPALPTVSGPYYSWSDLRAYLVGLIR